MKKLVFLLIFVLTTTFIQAQTIKNTSYVTATGEKVLRLEFELPIDIKTAWQLFTKDEQLQKWVAPMVHMVLKNGGYMVTNYDKSKSLTDSTSIKLGVVNYLEQDLITFKVKLNKHFSKSVQQEDQNLQEIIQFVSVAPNKTKIVSSMVGWGQGAEWNKTYDFFVKGNIWSYEQLTKLYRKER